MVKPDSNQDPGLHLYTSNRLEILAGTLAEALRRPLASVMQPEVVVVRNQGMERWLKLELARRHGICANQRFPFPEAFGRELFRAVLPEEPGHAPLDRETLTWRILKALPVLSRKADFASLAHYLQEPEATAAPPNGRKHLQLAARIANLFDQYLIFRPAMMLEWDAGRGEGWQPELWRAVSVGSTQDHAASLWRRFHEALADPGRAFPGLPERVAIFGVSALPPFYLDLFAALASRVQVNLFLLQPSQEYWGDITSPRESDRIRRRHLAGGEAPFDQHLHAGNRLLASLGYLGRDFLKLILDAGDWRSREDFFDPTEDSLLHAIQSDILHLRDRGKDAETPRREMAADDDSIQTHSCHSALREMEVLHDHLLDWFQRDPTLTPRDVVVMTPDIEACAPFVQAVFGAPEDPAREIPFSLADRGARREGHLIETFLQILDLSHRRLGAATVLALLETDALRARFNLGEGDLETIRSWVERTNIRWGADEAHRAGLGLPPLRGNTWRAGLDRLLLGFSMAGDGRLFDGMLPYDDLEGGAATVLGGFVEFITRIIDTVETLAEPRTLDGWVTAFDAILDRFFLPTDAAQPELQTLRDAFHPLRRHQKEAGFDAPVLLDVVLEQLRPALEEDRFAAGFLTGGVTFCGLKPMRSIPFRMVCLVGLNDGAFPRGVHHLSFDLMAKKPRLGDRSAREDDRYLFLETLLSARDRLYLSYVGQGVRDNKEAPPSVLISELLDYVEQGFGADAEAGRALRERLVTKHRLQAFHEDYFRPGHRCFSYSTVNAEASAFTRQPRTAPVDFVTGTMSEPPAECRQITLDDLAKFLANPSRFFLNKRLGIFLRQGREALEEREAFVLDGLNTYRLKEELVERLRADAALAEFRPVLEAGGDLPLGTVGDAAFRNVCARAEAFHTILSRHDLLDWTDPLEVDLALGPFRLTGRIAPRTLRGPLFFRCTKEIKASDLLRAWVHHLAACALSPELETVVVAESGWRRFSSAPEPLTGLGRLLDLYWQGLRAPLKFFPESALAFVETERQQQQAGKTSRRAATPLEKALEKWEGNEFGGVKSEAEEVHFEFCFRGSVPLEATFEALARSILEPALRLQTKEAW